MSKIALLLGSFDPPHVGHLELCTLVLNNCDIGGVWLVPAWQNPWKNSIPYEDRYYMCREVTAKIPRVHTSNIELRLSNNCEHPLFTSIVLERLSEENKNTEFYIIMTKETWNEVDNWKDGNIIKEKYKFLREGFDFPMHSFNIHSTDIRKLAKKGKILTPYVTPEVQSYIRDFGIYSS